MDSPHKGPVMKEVFHDAIMAVKFHMISSDILNYTL